MDNKYYKSPEPSWLMRQFWKAAGADNYLLERSTYSDQVKYFCLGGIVVATGAMAALAGGYAMYMIFEPKTNFAIDKDSIHIPTLMIASVFGLIWGLIIFNIDRFIVTSTGKGDGTEAITGQEFKSAIPRIIMGLIIALTISKPIEIRMFQSEINAEVTVIQKDFVNEMDSITTVSWDGKMLPFINKSDSLKKSVEDQRLEIKNQRRRLEDEAAGLLPPNPRGRGPAWKDKKENLDKMEAEFNVKKTTDSVEIASLKETTDRYNQKKADEFEINEKNKSSKDGLLLRLQLAHKIAGFWISLFITLLFIVIELTPIFFKMMLIKGPYDYMDENVRELARAEAGIEIEYNFYKDKDGIEAHKVVNRAAQMKSKERLLMIKAQEELNQKIIEKWKNNKLKDIDDDVNQFIDEE